MGFERGIDPKEAMEIGRIQYVENISKDFLHNLRRFWFTDLYSPGAKINAEEGYMSFDLDPYSNQGMEALQLAIERGINNYQGKLRFVDDDFLEDLYGDEWPEESPFYDEECIYVKIL